jgi:hypothetical protein
MMPDELSRYIQDFARPCTRPQWRKGSFYYQHATYGEFYWELFDGPWYDFDQTDEIMIAYFMHGMRNMSIAYMLRTLFYHKGETFTLLLFDRVKRNPYLCRELRDELEVYDIDAYFVFNLERMYV